MDRTLYIGIAGWSYPDWEGIVYTDKKIDQLEYISRFVDCIEINNTFYHPPNERNSKSWLRRTADKPGFFFTAKLHRDFTHEDRMDAGMIKEFHDGFAPMLEAGKLKTLLVQFKYDFADTQLSREHLSQIVGNFKDAFNLAVEVRHRSWQKPDGLKFLEALGVSVCNLDYPTTHNSFDMQVCTVGRFGYLRMHGRNFEKWFSKSTRDETYDYYYNKTELEKIKKRIEQLRKAFESLTVIANNHYRGSEVANAIELKAMITGGKQPVPEGLIKKYPNLAAIASNI